MTQQQQSGRMCGHESETGGAWLFTCRVWLGYGLVFGIKPVTQQSRSCCAAGSGAAGRRKTCRAAVAQPLRSRFPGAFGLLRRGSCAAAAHQVSRLGKPVAQQLRCCCTTGCSGQKTRCASAAQQVFGRSRRQPARHMTAAAALLLVFCRVRLLRSCCAAGCCSRLLHQVATSDASPSLFKRHTVALLLPPPTPVLHPASQQGPPTVATNKRT